MIIEYTTNGDVTFTNKNYNKLSKGIVIFPETVKEAKAIKHLKKLIKLWKLG